LELFKDNMSKEVIWNFEADPNKMWDTMAGCIRRISKEVLGESKGRAPAAKETWWWGNEAQTVVKIKKDYFKKWQNDKSEENLKLYKDACKDVKKAVRDAK